jgi:hypothetical protein
MHDFIEVRIQDAFPRSVIRKGDGRISGDGGIGYGNPAQGARRSQIQPVGAAEDVCGVGGQVHSEAEPITTRNRRSSGDGHFGGIVIQADVETGDIRGCSDHPKIKGPLCPRLDARGSGHQLDISCFYNSLPQCQPLDEDQGYGSEKNTTDAATHWSLHL